MGCVQGIPQDLWNTVVFVCLLSFSICLPFSLWMCSNFCLWRQNVGICWVLPWNQVVNENSLPSCTYLYIYINVLYIYILKKKNNLVFTLYLLIPSLQLKHVVWSLARIPRHRSVGVRRPAARYGGHRLQFGERNIDQSTRLRASHWFRARIPFTNGNPLYYSESILFLIKIQHHS